MRLVVISDSKGKKNGINEKILKKILTETTKLNPLPQYIVTCGDSVAGSKDETQLFSQLMKFRSLLKNYHKDISIIPAIGNHEVNISSLSYKYEKVFSQVYKDLPADDFLTGYNRTVYYFDHNDTRIFVLNSFHFGEIHKITNEQLRWFEEKASQNIKNKIVFMHSPAFPTGAHFGHCLDLYPKDRDAFWKVVDQCGVDIVFSGHEHNYSRRIITSAFGSSTGYFKRSVLQVISGGGGETLRDKFTSKAGVIVAPINEYHFLVVDIIKDYIQVAAISSNGKRLDEFKIDKKMCHSTFTEHPIF